MIAILFESYNHWRQIFLDGRPLQKTVQPVYMGYSVGKWDGDTLVVETIGFNDQGWLDDAQANVDMLNLFLRDPATGVFR